MKHTKHLLTNVLSDLSTIAAKNEIASLMFEDSFDVDAAIYWQNVALDIVECIKAIRQMSRQEFVAFLSWNPWTRELIQMAR